MDSNSPQNGWNNRLVRQVLRPFHQQHVEQHSWQPHGEVACKQQHDHCDHVGPAPLPPIGESALSYLIQFLKGNNEIDTDVVFGTVEEREDRELSKQEQARGDGNWLEAATEACDEPPTNTSLLVDAYRSKNCSLNSQTGRVFLLDRISLYFSE
jgi:hypothetical protein